MTAPLMLTEKELEQNTGISAWTWRRFRIEAGLPHIQVGSRYFYRLESVMSWLAEREQASCEGHKTL